MTTGTIHPDKPTTTSFSDNPSLIYSEEAKRWADDHEMLSYDSVCDLAFVVVGKKHLARVDNGFFIIALSQQNNPVYVLHYNANGETECTKLGDCGFCRALKAFCNVK